MNNFRVIIAGSRSFNDYNLLESTCNHLLENRLKSNNIVILSGCARGADSLGEIYAKNNGFEIEKHPADWDTFGKSAGYRRNAEMAVCADALIAFWDGKSRGTQHMIDIARSLGLDIRIINI